MKNRCQCPSCGHEFDPEFDGQVTDDSPEGLAQLWCFHLTRRKFGSPRDLPSDIAPEMGNMIAMGIHPARLRTEILRKGRDRGEYMWQFKQRFGLGLPIKGFAGMQTMMKPMETDTERLERIRLQREAADRERQQALSPEEIKSILQRARGTNG